MRDRPAIGGQLLAFSIDDAALRQIVGREFDADAVAWDDADKVLPHLSRDVREDQRSIINLHTKTCVCESLRDHALDFQSFFFLRH